MNQVLQGDCLEILKWMPDDHFDALITDPPAGIAFMSKDWDRDKGGMLDWINWLSEVMHEALRTMKPGAVGAVWSIPRTCGWTQMALELAGFRVFDCVQIINGAGFPKAQDIGKHIDRLADAEREVVGQSIYANKGRTKAKGWGMGASEFDDITAPATPEAQQWDGWKTPALKPAVESWFLVQKPISEKSIARNVLKWRTGGINVEAARIGTDICGWGGCGSKLHEGGLSQNGGDPRPVAGRYPANTILQCAPECTDDTHADHCPVSIMGEQSGEQVSGRASPNSRGKQIGLGKGCKEWRSYGTEGYGDTGTAARYFKQLPHDPDAFRYFTKANKRDRTCDGEVENVHPTVKSRYLMEYFCKLLCPPGGVILDPFGGSGSTALGALMAGMNYVLIEQDPDSAETARNRIYAWQGQTGQVPIEDRLQWLETQVQAQGQKIKRLERQQLSLFDPSQCL